MLVAATGAAKKVIFHQNKFSKDTSSEPIHYLYYVQLTITTVQRDTSLCMIQYFQTFASKKTLSKQRMKIAFNLVYWFRSQQYLEAMTKIDRNKFLWFY